MKVQSFRFSSKSLQALSLMGVLALTVSMGAFNAAHAFDLPGGGGPGGHFGGGAGDLGGHGMGPGAGPNVQIFSPGQNAPTLPPGAGTNVQVFGAGNEVIGPNDIQDPDGLLNGNAIGPDGEDLTAGKVQMQDFHFKADGPQGLQAGKVSMQDFHRDGLTAGKVSMQDFHFKANLPDPAADFDGDGRADMAIFGVGSGGIAPSHTPVADIDGDGKADLAIYGPGIGTFRGSVLGRGDARARIGSPLDPGLSDVIVTSLVNDQGNRIGSPLDAIMSDVLVTSFTHGQGSDK